MKFPALLVTVVLAGSATHDASAQGPWSIFVAGGAVGFGGASRAVETPPLGVPDQYKPAPTVRLRFGVERNLGSLSLRLAGGYAQAGLGAYGEDLTSVTLDPGASLYELYLMAGYRLARLSSGTTFTLRAGPLLQVWEGDFTLDTQSNWGGIGSLTVAAPITHTLALEAEGSLSVAGSPFIPENFAGLPVAYEATSVWTRELSVGLRYRF